jgi:hypothetical protein
MQSHTRVPNCSCEAAGSHQEESPSTTRDEEAELRDRQDLGEMGTRGLHQESGQINMRVASSIPSQVVAGCAMDTPLVVLLHRDVQSLTAVDDIWVFVSLIDASPNMSAGESDDVLKGQRADNAHPILGQFNGVTSGDPFAYASFSNLMISRSGRYRLCVTAIDMRFVKTICRG